MKLLIIVFVLVFALPIYAQDPVVKFYLNDGSQAKEYRIEDITEMNFLKTNLSYSMEIFIDGSINTYNIKDINSIECIDSSQLKINLSSSSESISTTDIDSIIFVPNTCTEIAIGTQTWMCKNLDVDHYRNGDSIPQVMDNTEWAKLKTGGWCYYNNDTNNGQTYGKLYNWYAVNDPRGLAPDGWHVPNDEEWQTLEMYLGMTQSQANSTQWRGTDEGGKLKETGTTHWKSPNEGATNESGFSALPGGVRHNTGEFRDVGGSGAWWNSSELYSNTAWYRHIVNHYPYIVRFWFSKVDGMSVRCVKD
ncbi:MAG: fibrobacter succinogenes major paralogous domain-containing protein [bacterium]